MMNNYNSLSIGLVSYLKKWSNNSVGSPPTINIPEKQKKMHSYGIFILLFSICLGLFSSNAIAQTTLIGSGGNGGFETGGTLTANNWIGVTGSTDAWTVGTVPGSSAGTNCAYVSNNGGAAWAYSQTSTIEHLYTDVTIPAGQTSLTLTFKWKAEGEGTGTTNDWDNLKVFWGLASAFTPIANGAIAAGNQVAGPGAINGMYKLSSSAYNSETITFSGIAGSTYRLAFSWKSDISDIANPPAAIDEINLVANPPAAITSVQGGLWNSPATWAGGVVPVIGNNVVISAGHIVTQNVNVSINSLTINGTLQHGTLATGGFTTSVTGKLLINTGGRYLPYTTGQEFTNTVTIIGDFENNGYANLYLTTLNFGDNGSAGTLLSGTGTFQGDGVGGRGVVRSLRFGNTGTNVINTSQNLVVTSGITQLFGSVNTNGKVTCDNTVQLHGQPINTSVANIVVTAMGSNYSTQPVVFGLSVVQYADGLSAVVNNRYVYQNNVYVCTTGGTFNSTPPTFAALNVLDSTSGPELLYLGQIGTLGTPAPYNQALTVGANYFYAGNLYAAVATTASTTMPTHISGVVGSYLYIGTPATASVNWDATTQTVRSLTLNNAGTGLAPYAVLLPTPATILANPSITFSRGDLDTTGSGATAIGVVITRFTALATHLIQKSSGWPLTGGLTINSNQNANVLSSNHPQSASGLGNLSTFNGGLNYTVAPTVGFSPPTTLNLVTNSGSGYTTAPTIVVTGGNLVSGVGLTSANFTITVNNGSVVSVYYTAVTGSAANTPTYSVLPTLSFSSGSATLAWPANCLPAATANIGANGQLLSYTITNSGFGYLANVGTAQGSIPANAGMVVGLLGGTFTLAAAAPTPVVASYSIRTAFFGGSALAMTTENEAYIPANRIMNRLDMDGNGLGINLTSNLTLIGGAPLNLVASGVGTGNVVNLGGNNLNFTWHGYTGTVPTYNASVGSFAYVKNGSISLTHKGGTGTLNFPFSGAGTGPYTAGFVFNKGLTPTAITTGSTVTRVTVTETAAPSNTSLGSGFAKGARAYRLQNEVGAVHGTTPTVTLSFNDTDALTGVTQNALFVGESPSLSGPWTNETAAYGASGVLPSNGFLATPTVAPGPIAPTGDTYYAWTTLPPTITNVTPTTLCASSGAFTITGTNLSSTSAISIGGTPVASFLVVNDTTITGIAGPGTSGNLTVTTVGGAANGPVAITLLAVPVAPTVSASSLTVEYGVAANVTASGTGPTFNWYSAPTAGTLLSTGATFNGFVCASTTIYAAQSNGTCESPRTPVVVTVNQRVISATAPIFCGTGGSTVLSITPVPGATSYAWSKLTPSATFTSGTTSTSATVTVTETSDFSLLITGPGTCTSTVFYSVSVYPLPTATVTTTANGVCPLTAATINSGLSATNFTSSTIPYSTRPPVNAVTLATGGAAVVPMTGVFDLDDGGWGAIPIGFSFNFFGTTYTTINVGTNATLQFGAYNGNFGNQVPPGLNDYEFSTLPNPSEPLNMVALLANDNDLTNSPGVGGASGGTLRYWTEGIAPNRKFVVDYSAVRQYSATATTNTSTSQAVFYETTGVIDVNITGSTSTNNKVVGINNGNGTAGALAFASTAPITTPVSYRFTPPYNYNTTWTEDVGEGPNTIASGVNVFTLPVSPTQTTTYTISYTNQITGCQNALNSAQVIMTVLGTTAPVGVTTLASNAIVCPSSPTTNLSLGNLASIDGLTFQWQINSGAGYADISGAIASTYTATPTVLTTLYRCQIKSCNGTAAPSAAVSVSKPVVTPLTLSANAITLCAGGSQTVLVTSGASYYSAFTWSPNTVTGDETTGYIFNTAGTYTLTAAAPVNGCSATAQVIVTVNAVATTPVFTPSAPTYSCNAPGTLITVGSGFTNPTPVGSCLAGIQFPINSIIPSTCDGTTETIISTTCFTAEYSGVFVSANVRYTFISSGVGDIVEITSPSGLTLLARGPSPLVWFNDAGVTSVRFYTQNATCTQDQTNRTRSVICLPPTSVVFSPATGLFTDITGFVPYDGVTPVTQIYARPNATQTYTAISNNVFGCPAAPVNVTVTVAPCNSIVNLKLFIEGYYEGPNMRSVKNNQDGASPMTDVEDITVELHDAASPYATVATASALLKTDGTAVCTFPPGTAGSYYIAVRNSNALETWSANPQTVSSVPLTFDFSNAANKAYGANMLDLAASGVFGFYSGDINQDDVIDGSDATSLDLAIFNSEFGVQITDLNGDGSVDGSDSTYYENNSFNSVFANYPQ